MTSKRDQRDRQEEEWSIPVSAGRRGRDIPVGQDSLHRTPPTPAPLEDKFFTDWSSLGSGSPHVRMPPQSGLVRERGQTLINLLTRQLNLEWSQTQIGVMENAFQEDTFVSPPRT